MGKKVLIAGSTGMVGGEVLKICLASDEVYKVITLDRDKSSFKHKKLKKIVHDDFLDYSVVEKNLKGIDIVYYCIGTYTGSVSRKRFREITVDYLREFAKAVKKKSPEAVFCLLSASKADRSERSLVMFMKDKGAAENVLLEVGFPKMYFFRPHYIYPTTPRKEPNIGYVIMRKLSFLLRWFYPKGMITSEQLADVMFLVGLEEEKKKIYENSEMRKYLGL